MLSPGLRSVRHGAGDRGCRSGQARAQHGVQGCCKNEQVERPSTSKCAVISDGWDGARLKIPAERIGLLPHDVHWLESK
jgi:hypothetical protein